MASRTFLDRGSSGLLVLLKILVSLHTCTVRAHTLGGIHQTRLGSPVSAPGISEFSLGSVKLKPGSQAAVAADLNRQYLLMIDTDSLLYAFRQTAGLPHPGTPYFGSWEDPSCEVRGEFTGHYLSATALWVNHTGDAAVRDRADTLVAELAKIQDIIGTGYLSAFPAEHFDRLQNLQPVWAPFYVIHKIMTGLYDQFTLNDSDLALKIALDMADYFVDRIDETIQVNGTARWIEMLEVEYGGMQEIMTKLWALTGNKDYLRIADLFIKETFYQPLVDKQDDLEGRHANTHLAQVNGFAARHDFTSDASSFAAVSNFFNFICTAHSYTTGGSNDNEFWGPPSELGDSLEAARALNTQESCTTYNILKIARSLFRWTGNVHYADFYERALYNGVLGIQRMPSASAASHPAMVAAGVMADRSASAVASRLQSITHGTTFLSLYRAAGRRGQPSVAQRQDTDAPGPGVYLYLTPLGAGNRKSDNFHGWGHRFSSFWCCYGTAIESFAKLADSIFFYQQPKDQPPVLIVNQFIPATLSWDAVDMNVALDSELEGDDGVARISLSFDADATRATADSAALGTTHAPALHLKVRIPAWTKPDGVRLALDGEEIACTNSGQDGSGYCSIIRSFRSGQTLDVKFPMVARVETLQDARPVYQVFKSVILGPHLMAGLTHSSRTLMADPAQIASLVEPLSSEGHLSLAPELAPPGMFLRHDAGGIYLSEIEDGGDALDATFRLVPASSSAIRKDKRTVALAALEQWLHRAGPRPPVEQVLVEAAGEPGGFVGVSGTSEYEKDPGAAILVHKPSREGPHSFWLRRGLSGAPGTISLELVDRPGSYLSAFVSPEDLGDCTRRALNPQTTISGCESNSFRLRCRHSCGAVIPTLRRLRIAPSPGFAADIGEAAALFASASSFQVAPPQGRYPQGSRLLRGDDRNYVISPLSRIVDERYTAYFEWVTPHTMAAKRSPWTLWPAGYAGRAAATLLLGFVGFLLVSCCHGNRHVQHARPPAVAQQAACARPSIFTAPLRPPAGTARAASAAASVRTRQTPTPNAKPQPPCAGSLSAAPSAPAAGTAVLARQFHAATAQPPTELPPAAKPSDASDSDDGRQWQMVDE